MYTYSKYIIKITLLPLLLLALILTSLVWITQVLNLINILDRGIGLGFFLKLTLLLLPYLLFMIMPIITVLAIIYIYGKMQAERQLIALRNAGLSNYQLAKPALLVAIIMTLISYSLSAYFMPISYHHLKSHLIQLRENYISSIIESKAFNQVSQNYTLYVDQKNSDQSLSGVILFDTSIPQNKIIFLAKIGRIKYLERTKMEIELINGMHHFFDKNGHLIKSHFDKMVIDIIKENINPHAQNKKSLELFIHEMLWPDNDIPLDKQKKLVVDAHARIIWPLFNFVLTFLALSTFLSTTPTRKSTVKQYVYIIVSVVVVLYANFTLQKIAYRDSGYIFYCYVNMMFCITIGIWHNYQHDVYKLLRAIR